MIGPHIDERPRIFLASDNATYPKDPKINGLGDVGEKNNKQRTVSLRNSILLLSFFSVVSVALVSVVPSYTFGFSSVNDISDQLQTQTVERISQEMQAYLDTPHELLRGFEATIFEFDLGNNGISCNNYAARLMNVGVFEKSAAFSQAFFGLEDGSVFGASKTPLTLGCAVPETNYELWDVYVSRATIKNPFNELPIFGKRPGFNSTKRPWYSTAKIKRGPTWSPVFPTIGTGSGALSIAAARPIFKDLNETIIVGVAAIATNLSLVQQKLKSIKTTENGEAYILQKDGSIIANTLGVPLVGEDKKTLPYKNSNNKLMIKSADKLEKDSTDGLEPIDGIRKFSTYKGDKEYLTFASTLVDPRGGIEWTVVILIPRSDIFSKVDSMIVLSSSLTAALFVVTLIVTMVVSTYISRPLNVVADAMQNISRLNFDKRASGDSSSTLREIRMIQSSFQVMDTALQSFGKFVPMEVVKRIMNNSAFAHGLYVERKMLTLMFSDLKGFTSLAESLPMDTLLILLSDYLEMMTSMVSLSEGVICDFIGDGIMSFWNSPIPVAFHEASAIKTALLQSEALKNLNGKWISNGYISEGLEMRIGIHTGEVLVGNIGSTNRMKYGAVGDAVNIASRLEGLNKRYCTEILISEVTYERVKELFMCRPLESVVVKGRTESIKIYEVLGSIEDFKSESSRALIEKKKNVLEIIQNLHLKSQDIKMLAIDQLRDYVCHNDDITAYKILEIVTSPSYNGISILDAK